MKTLVCLRTDLHTYRFCTGANRGLSFCTWPSTFRTIRYRARSSGALAELCDIPLPKIEIDGKSLVNVIHSSQADTPHESFIWKSGGSQQVPQWAVREGDWKLVHNPLGNSLFPNNEDPEKLYLFNILNDVGEKTNEADAHPEIVKRLRSRYQVWDRGLSPPTLKLRRAGRD